MATLNSNQLVLEWETRFPLRDAFLKMKDFSGIYLWGFDSPQGEVIWYVGKAKKGVYRRLTEHYLNIMSGQYQIPIGFLNGQFVEPNCTKSGWWLRRGDEIHASRLQDWSTMKVTHEAGHRFANAAFARTAFSKDGNILKDMERSAIFELEPAINKQAKRSDEIFIHLENQIELGWIKRWKKSRCSKGYSMV
jgi:hypothetical protein